jgi:type I restriction enzyme, S subunit
MWQGAVGVAPVDGLVSPAYVVAQPHPEVEGRYYAYLFRTAAYMNEVNKYSHGIVTDRNRLYWDEFKQMPSAFPPPTEQTAIANFLDRHGNYVRRFIRNKRRLIELLNEQKQAIVNRAVTRGIDPDARLNNSGVDWLGDIPEHWQIERFKYIASFTSGGTPTTDRSHYWGGDIPWVSPKDMKLFVINDALDHVTESAIQEGLTSLLPAGSVLIVVRSGILRRKIPVAVTTREVAINQDLKGIHLRSGSLLPAFLTHLIFDNQQALLIKWRKHGATVESIEHSLLANSYLPVPPVREQEAILESISIMSAPIDAAISRALREIDLIREYRARLIADAVTGKVDVRRVAPEIIEPALEDLEPLDDDDKFIEEESHVQEDFELAEESLS